MTKLAEVNAAISGLIQAITKDPGVGQVINDVSAGVGQADLSCPMSARATLCAAIAQERPLLIVTATFRQAEQLVDELASLIGQSLVCYYPAWETLPHERLSPRSDTVAKRLAVLRRLAGNDELGAPKIIVAPIRAVLQPQAGDLGKLPVVKVKVGDEYPLEELSKDLVAAAYSRVDLVERRGEFAIRGGIADVFPPSCSHPVRIDFFGDEVDSITYFSVADQRSTSQSVPEIIAAPCRELLLTDEVRHRAAMLIPKHPELAEMLTKISEGQACEGMESLLPVLAERLELLVDVLAKNALVCVFDPELVRSRADDLVRTSQDFLHAGWVSAAAGGQAPINLAPSAYKSLGDVRMHALEKGLSWWTISPFSADANSNRNLDIHESGTWRGDVEAAISRIADDVKSGFATVLSVEGKGLSSRFAELLGDHDIAAKQVSQLTDLPQPYVVAIVCSQLRRGFRVPGAKLAVYTGGDLTGSQDGDRHARRMPSKRKNQVVVEQLKVGEPLVHTQHGVGRFVELTQRTIRGATREYLVLEYAPSKRGQPPDRLYVPMDQLDLVTKYVGGEVPQLDKLGGADWKQRKARAKRAVKSIAAGLIKLYAARQATKGHAFSPDTVWQRELEDAFNYVETPDQMAAIQDVKHDMEQVIPMDRLISGDVGYGKTEIAVRAAFKAVQDNKQVAVLVPTTLLVQQHLATFEDRYAGFPVSVAALSRFQSEAEISKTLDDLAAGRVDVVIGTHRLFSDKVKFKDLGLVIIDEEQRFGVEHKEALKKMRVNVDVLSMSATPIPRTLEMAVTGIREMSTIATPPEERHPVLTFAGPYDDGQVGAAIRRELAREGQVFFVHNRVSDIEKSAAKIRELVPQARVVVAHGQMSERQLEQVMVDFWERRADVLVCTTIVEAGLDISTANTLIVDRGDQLGLAQLHQLRGRVGRSRERGYAYFFYPPNKTISQTAHERLSALAQNADLGAGMAIAMKDLEIRGAGNLLGDQQSGHIADVGFDLYLRLVGDAVAAFKGESTTEDAPVMRIELPVDAHLPENYINSERLRLEMYRRIAEASSEQDLADLHVELEDRYGAVPEQTETLLEVARFRLLCASVGVREVVTQGNMIRFSPIFERQVGEKTLDLPESRQLRLQRLYPGTILKKPANLMLVPKPAVSEDVLVWARRVVTDVLLPAKQG